MTDKLFYQDSHLKEFEAKVIDCQKCDDYYNVILDRTAFFPEGGGQSADEGSLNDIPVLDVQEEDGVIYHRTEQYFEPGLMVCGVVDYEKRFSRMQQHTGEHIVSGIVHEMFKYDNVGFHLGHDEVTMDFNGELSMEELRTVERKANEAVAANLPVLVTYPSESELINLDYRSKKEIKGVVRIVTIPGYDVCACCAPHTKYTGEIGLIKLTGIQNHKGGVRVSMLCGFLALDDYNRKEENVSRISVLLSAKPGEVAEHVLRVQQEVQKYKQKLQEFQQFYLERERRNITDSTVDFSLFMEEADKNIVRRFVDDAKELCQGVCAVFVGNDDDGYRYVMGSDTIDMRSYSRTLNAELDGKGGGSRQMVQGTLLSDEIKIRRFLKSHTAEKLST